MCFRKYITSLYLRHFVNAYTLSNIHTLILTLYGSAMTHKHAKCKIKVFSLLSFSLLHRSDTDTGKSLICPGCLAPRTQEFSGPTLGFRGSRERRRASHSSHTFMCIRTCLRCELKSSGTVSGKDICLSCFFYSVVVMLGFVNKQLLYRISRFQIS